MERIDLLHQFLKKNNWDDGDRKLLAADASFRHYDRIVKGKESRVLMDAPPPMEDIRPFVAVDQKLEQLGFTVPHIYDLDETNGFILLSDMGDDTYTRLINKGYDESSLYALATDVLVKLHTIPEKDVIPNNLPKYDNEALLKEANLFTEWYMPAVFGKKTDPAVAKEYEELWLKLFAKIHATPQTMVLRDYHVDNLMIVPGKTGLEQCGLLDFQDALHGSIIYDIMSLLEDARRDIAPDLYKTMQDRYITGVGIKNVEEFKTAWAILAAQRHAKVLGIFVRLCVRDHKPKYLVHIQRLWRLIERALQHPVLSELKIWFDKNVPAEYRITPDVADKK